MINNNSINDNTAAIKDDGYDGYFRETEEDNLNIYLKHQVHATNFEVLPREYPIRLREAPK